MFVEIAIGSPSKRGTLVPIDELWDIVYEYGKNQAVYRSVYLYDDEALIFTKKSGTLKNYLGTRYIDEIPIDIDKGQNTDEYTLKRAQAVLFHLTDELGLKEGNFQCYYSGTGYHITLSGGCFGFEASPDLPFIVKQTMTSSFDDIDPSVYIRTALIRLPHTLNIKSELFKVPLTREELMGSTPDTIVKLASSRRLDLGIADLWGEETLSSLIKRDVPKVREMKSVLEPRNIVPCMQTLYKRGPVSGTRNNTILRLAGHFRRNGITSEATKAALLHWNDNQLNPQIIIDKVEATYNYGYKYGCEDEILVPVCEPRCVYYKNKDYSIDVKNREELQKDLSERIETDYSGRMIDLARMFGLQDKDCAIYPGELVTIFGPTGSNKTTLAQNIVLGYDFKEDIIRKEWQQPTLFLSLELSGWYMHRRNLQIVSGMDKEQVTRNHSYVGTTFGDNLGHINIQTVSANVETIQKQIKNLQPNVVVIDYIDLLETPKHIRGGEYEQIRYISHFLSNLAVNSDIIIIQISQVSREYSRNEILDIYAGKGSGAIENASRKVIGINGKQNEADKTVSLFKNSDGDLFDVELEWKPSFRLPVKGVSDENTHHQSRSET
jgi:hypothetical protein